MLRRKLLGVLGLGGAATAAVGFPRVVEASKTGAAVRPSEQQDGPGGDKMPVTFVSPYNSLRVQISETRAVQFRDGHLLTTDAEEIGALRLLLAQANKDFRLSTSDNGTTNRLARKTDFQEWHRPDGPIPVVPRTGLGYPSKPWSPQRLADAMAPLTIIANKIRKRGTRG